jgi:hypothetical protein
LKKPLHRGFLVFLAERGGFEPPVGYEPFHCVSRGDYRGISRRRDAPFCPVIPLTFPQDRSLEIDLNGNMQSTKVHASVVQSKEH